MPQSFQAFLVSDKIMSSRFSVVYIGDQACHALVQFICPFIMPDFPFHWHSEDKVLFFSCFKT